MAKQFMVFAVILVAGMLFSMPGVSDAVEYSRCFEQAWARCKNLSGPPREACFKDYKETYCPDTGSTK